MGTRHACPATRFGALAGCFQVGCGWRTRIKNWAVEAKRFESGRIVRHRSFVKDRVKITEMAEIVIYSTHWCGDCRRTKQFLVERGVVFREVNIDETPEAEGLVLRVNDGRRKVPTIEIDGRYFTCSPFDPYQLSEKLNVPLNLCRPR